MKNRCKGEIYNTPELQTTYNLQELHLYSRNKGDTVTLNLPFILYIPPN